MLGLMPLRRNPVSGLWEFLHVLSGDAPRESADGGLRMAPESGIVLVLLPGAVARMGARRPDVGDPPDAPNVDPLAAASEAPIDDVPLDPFFISKFEMTRAQWIRLQGVIPGPIRQAAMRADTREGTAIPAAFIDWIESKAALGRVGLDLPTEAWGVEGVMFRFQIPESMIAVQSVRKPK